MSKRENGGARNSPDKKAGQDPVPIATPVDLPPQSPPLTETHAPLSVKRRLLSGGAWASGGRVAAALTALATNALLARLLSPQDLGTYFLAYSVVGLGWAVGSLGLNQTVVRFVAEGLGLNQPGRARRVIVMVLGLGAAGALGVGLVYVLLGGFLADHLFEAPALAAVTGLVAGWMIVVSLQGHLAETFRGFHDIRLATIFGNFNGLLTGSLLVASLVLLWSLDGEAALTTVILLAAGSSCASLLLAGWALRRKVKSLLRHDAGPTVGFEEVLRVSWPLLITNLLVFVLAQADLWIVGAFLPQEEVAVYGAAARTVLLVAMPMVITEAIVPPLIAEMYAQGNKPELERTLRTVATLAGIPASLFLIGLALLGGPMLTLIFGNYYAGGALVLALLSIGQLSNVWVGSCPHTLMMTGHQVTAMVIAVSSGTLTIVAGLWAVGHYGVLGVAAAVAVGTAIRSVSMLLAARYKTGIWTHFGAANFAGLIRTIRRS